MYPDNVYMLIPITDCIRHSKPKHVHLHMLINRPSSELDIELHLHLN